MVNPKPKTRRVRPGEDDKPKGDWKTKTLKEVQTSDGVKWRAQLSIAPDGTKFAGIRKVAVKKDGTEVMTRDGLSFKHSASLPDEVNVIRDLLSVLIKPKKPEADDAFMLVHKVKELPLTGVKDDKGITAKHKPISVFACAEDAKDFRSKLTNGADFKVKRNG